MDKTRCLTTTDSYCTGCKKIIQSKTLRIPRRYERILPLVQYLRPEATMESSFCGKCFRKILDRWERSREKRQAATLILSSITSNTIVSSSSVSEPSEDSLDRITSLAAQTPEWKIAAANLLTTRRKNLNSSSSYTSFFASSEEPLSPIRTAAESPVPEIDLTDEPEEPNHIPIPQKKQPTEISPIRTVAESPLPEIDVTDESRESNRIPIPRKKQRREITPIRTVAELPLLEVDVTDESGESNHIPIPRKKQPRVRVRRIRSGSPPDPNADINFHERFSGG